MSLYPDTEPHYIQDPLGRDEEPEEPEEVPELTPERLQAVGILQGLCAHMMRWEHAAYWVLTSAAAYLSDGPAYRRDGEGSTVEMYFPEKREEKHEEPDDDFPF